MDREQKRIVEKLNIIDDTFFHKLTEDKSVCEEMLRTFLESEEIQVVSNQPQMYWCTFGDTGCLVQRCRREIF